MRADPYATAAEVITIDKPGQRYRIEDIYPAVDDGRYPVKRIVGEPIEIWADIIGDGHDIVAGAIRWRRDRDAAWQSTTMHLHGNDRWHATIQPAETGRYTFVIEAWSDLFATWRKGFLLKLDAGQEVGVDAQEGAAIIEQLLQPAGPHRDIAQAAIDAFRRDGSFAELTSPLLLEALSHTAQRADLSHSAPIPLMIERVRARAGAWYEMVPRSQGTVPGRHGTFDDCIRRVPEIAELGFDVLYLTPIHPIGKTHRKGKNNSLQAQPGDPGSFYAVGDASGCLLYTSPSPRD